MLSPSSYEIRGGKNTPDSKHPCWQSFKKGLQTSTHTDPSISQITNIHHIATEFIEYKVFACRSIKNRENWGSYWLDWLSHAGRFPTTKTSLRFQNMVATVFRHLNTSAINSWCWIELGLTQKNGASNSNDGGGNTNRTRVSPHNNNRPEGSSTSRGIWGCSHCCVTKLIHVATYTTYTAIVSIYCCTCTNRAGKKSTGGSSTRTKSNNG